ncbi:unnamed protein product [Pleuronectes platessa]|uniref:Protein DBF4 homolog A n=1 Tax=Pleuronectes platessa TaxID=8262 RepID=A0A9N7YBX6_PLEPL|nr:unnamed protein product [Pleuronectes platessa]
MKESDMKPKRIQRHRGANCRGKSVDTGDTTTLSQAKPPSLVSSSARNKPFAGKVFYLDLPSNRTAETLERDIKQLGGIVEKFFSKEIKYLVSNKREARYVQCLRQDSPVPSPDSGPSSPHPRSNPHRPGSHGDNMKSRSQGQTDTLVTSRGKSLVERVVKEQERIQMNKILSNALDWGVKILYIDDVMAYVKKRKKIFGSQCPATSAARTIVKAGSASKQGFQKCRGGRIGKPFVKVEDSSRHYRPIYLTMSNMPEFNLKTVPPCSPFSVEDKNSPGNKQEGQRGAKASASEDRAHGRKKTRDKKRGGYCECCMVKYENLTMHLQSVRHKAFSKSDEYLVVDRQVSTLPCNFIHINTKVKRPKCSVSSVLVAPGPCGETELRHRGDVVTAETVKEEQQQTVEVESYSGHALKIRSVPDFARLAHRERDWRNCRTYSERSKAKSLALKRDCGRWSSRSGYRLTNGQVREKCRCLASVAVVSVEARRAADGTGFGGSQPDLKLWYGHAGRSGRDTGSRLVVFRRVFVLYPFVTESLSHVWIRSSSQACDALHTAVRHGPSFSVFVTRRCLCFRSPSLRSVRYVPTCAWVRIRLYMPGIGGPDPPGVGLTGCSPGGGRSCAISRPALPCCRAASVWQTAVSPFPHSSSSRGVLTPSLCPVVRVLGPSCFPCPFPSPTLGPFCCTASLPASVSLPLSPLFLPTCLRPLSPGRVWARWPNNRHVTRAVSCAASTSPLTHRLGAGRSDQDPDLQKQRWAGNCTVLRASRESPASAQGVKTTCPGANDCGGNSRPPR